MNSQFKNRQNLEEMADEVTLEPGDVLYHPAGIWHCVRSDEDSIAINFSMKAMRMGEFIIQAI